MKLFKRILKSERGQALPMALLLLALGGLLVVPSVGLMATNLTANRVVDRANLELYAADAGVEKVLWNIKYNQPTFTLPADGNETTLQPFTLNGKTVNAKIDKQAGQSYYKITSTATADEHSTTVQCFVNTQADFSWLFEHAITSGGDVWTKKSDIINGGILYEGTFDHNAQVNGEIVNKPVTLPTAAELSPFYWEDVKTLTPYGSDSYVIPGGTPSSPHMIPSLYRNGNLTITGSGYAKLSGTVYVKGNFSVNDKNSIMNLNGQTIYAEGTVYFKPGCTIYGPGCIIAVGDVNFQPNMGMGAKLLGVDDMSASEADSPNMFLLSKFQAVKSGKLTSFQVKCSGPGKVKVALYADSGGAPGARLGAVDTDTDVMAAGWTPINFPETQVNSGTYYWLAAISDSAIIYRYATSSTNKYKPASYSAFTFPDPAGSGFSSQNTKQYMLAGYEGSQEFIFVMSLNGNTNIQPGGTFYGSIAGNAYVNLQPNCTVQLVGLPAGGLNIPGGGSGGGGTGNQVTILTYTIQ